MRECDAEERNDTAEEAICSECTEIEFDENPYGFLIPEVRLITRLNQ